MGQPIYLLLGIKLDFVYYYGCLIFKQLKFLNMIYCNL